MSAKPASWYDPTAESRKEVAWKPAVGDSIVGRVLDIDTRTTTWKDQSKDVVVLILDTGSADHVSSVWGLHTVLASELVKAAPEIGEEIGITRLADSDMGYKRYKVRVRRDTPRKFDWKRVNPAGSDVAPESVADVLGLEQREQPKRRAQPSSPVDDDDNLPF